MGTNEYGKKSTWSAYRWLPGGLLLPLCRGGRACFKGKGLTVEKGLFLGEKAPVGEVLLLGRAFAVLGVSDGHLGPLSACGESLLQSRKSLTVGIGFL